MPDVRVKVYRGDFPHKDVIEKMKTGDRFIWIPETQWRKLYSMGPIFYHMTKRGLTSDTLAASLVLIAPRG